jgi:hypothetical protein
VDRQARIRRDFCEDNFQKETLGREMMLGPGFTLYRDGGGIGLFTRLFLFLAFSLIESNAQKPINPTEDGVELMVLAESDFLWDDDNWTISGNASNFQHSTRMIKAADDGPDTWYFVAPGKFTGAKRAAYGGKIQFKHGFFEYNRSEILVVWKSN